MPVDYEMRDHIATLTLNRPEALNAFDEPMYRDFNRAFARFRDDPDAWVAIIVGAGERAFTVGADVKAVDAEISRGGSIATWELDPEGEFATAKPIIAAVNGHCVGEGMSLITACDFRIASETARFSWPEPKIGLPTVNGAITATRVMGLGHALELLLIGEPRDAAWAYRTGLVNIVVPQAELANEARRWAQKLCQVGPLAVQVTKEVAVRAQYSSFSQAMAMGIALRRPLYHSEDAKEGMTAFAQKRPPQFRGR